MPYFEVYLGKDNDYHWRLVATNGRIVCWSEGYETQQGAKNSVAWVKENAPPAPLK